MPENKTQMTRASVADFIRSVKDAGRAKDCRTIMKLMRDATGAGPRMWGPSIVGYGTYHCKYASGRELDWFLTGFSPRKQNLTLYIMSGFSQHKELMRKLGKHTTGKSCLYIKELEDVDLGVLKRLIKASVKTPMGAVQH
jgi:hypothetical protein